MAEQCHTNFFNKIAKYIDKLLKFKCETEIRNEYRYCEYSLISNGYNKFVRFVHPNKYFCEEISFIFNNIEKLNSLKITNIIDNKLYGLIQFLIQFVANEKIYTTNIKIEDVCDNGKRIYQLNIVSLDIDENILTEFDPPFIYNKIDLMNIKETDFEWSNNKIILDEIHDVVNNIDKYINEKEVEKINFHIKSYGLMYRFWIMLKEKYNLPYDIINNKTIITNDPNIDIITDEKSKKLYINTKNILTHGKYLTNDFCFYNNSEPKNGETNIILVYHSFNETKYENLINKIKNIENIDSICTLKKHYESIEFAYYIYLIKMKNGEYIYVYFYLQNIDNNENIIRININHVDCLNSKQFEEQGDQIIEYNITEYLTNKYTSKNEFGFLDKKLMDLDLKDYKQ